MVSNDRSTRIYAHAQIYSQIAKYVNQSGKMQFLIPSQVIAALSLELHFKSLFQLEKNTDFKINGRFSHDFHALFCELSNESRNEIRTDFDNAIKTRDMTDVKMLESETKNKISLDLDENLEIWSTIFTKARYIFEGNWGESMMFFPEIEKAVVTRIKKIKEKSNV